jgi:hypothetical protein
MAIPFGNARRTSSIDENMERGSMYRVRFMTRERDTRQRKKVAVGLVGGIEVTAGLAELEVTLGIKVIC